MRPTLLATLALPFVFSPAASAQENGPDCGSGVVPICYGENVQCTISPASDIDTYQFVAQFRDIVRIVVAGKTKNLDPKVEVYRPDGTFHSSDSCSADANNTCTFGHTVTLDQAGIWTLVVTDAGSNNAGSYSMHLEQIPPTGVVPILDYGQSVTVKIDHLGDQDWFRVESNAGTNIRFSVAGLTKNLDPRLQVWDANGMFVDGDFCNADANNVCSFNLTLNPAPQGPLFIVLFDNGWNNLGSLSLTLQCIIGNCPPPNPPGPLGTNYCATTPNSTGVPSVMGAVGSPVIADNDVHLVLSNAPTGSFGIFFFGPGTTNTPLPPPSQGILCVSGPVRLPIALTCNDGTMHYDLDLTALPQNKVFMIGQTWNFQGWFRDQNPGSTSNTSDGLAITFQ